MTTEPGQVYLVNLGTDAKTRPMLVVSRKDEGMPRALSVCAPITTSTRDSRYEVAIGKLKFLHANSFVNVQGLQAIQHRELKSVIGRLPEDRMVDVRNALVWMLELPEKK